MLNKSTQKLIKEVAEYICSTDEDISYHVEVDTDDEGKGYKTYVADNMPIVFTDNDMQNCLNTAVANVLADDGDL